MAASITEPRALHGTRTSVATQGDAGVLLLVAAATAIMLQATRVFLSYMVFIIDQSERVQLGVTAGAVYLAIALGAFLSRPGAGRRIGLALTLGMVVSRLLLQFWTLPEARMWLGAATIVFAGWLLPLLLVWSRSAAAFGVGIGLALDVALRISRGSLDMALSPSVWAHAATMLLGLMAMLGAVMLTGDARPTVARGLASTAIVFGPALALHHLVTGNLGAVQVRLDVSLSASAWLLTAGMILGLAIIRLGDARLASSRVAIATFVAGGALGLMVFWQDSGGLGTAAIVIGTACTMALILTALGGGSGNGGVVATALWLSLGVLIHAILLFVYFTATGFPLLIGVLFGVLALGALLVAWRPAVDRLPFRFSFAGVGIVAIILVAASLIVTVGSMSQDAEEPLPAEFTIMTYNIQSGFSRDNYWDLEEIARVIEDADPDVVILQEVGRGWPILSGVDQAEWLSTRLDMQLVWGPASLDDLWGNAILTSAPIISTDWIKYDTTENLRRGAVRAEIQTEAGPVVMINTHLDNPGSATSARQAQITQLLEFSPEDVPLLLGGDLNTDPGSDAMEMLTDAGLIDTGADLGDDATTSDDARRIDYILTTGEFDVVSAHIPETWASDHKPYVVTVRISP